MVSPPPPNPPPRKPMLAMVGGGVVPYRLHFHRRLTAEAPEYRLVHFNTHHPKSEPWGITEAPGLEIIQCDRRAKPPRSMLADLPHQWLVGSRVLQELNRGPVAGVVLNGYNHLAHLRVLHWCKRRGVPVLLNSDSNAYGDTRAGLARLVKNTLVGHVVSRVGAITVCGSLGRRYFERYGADPARIFFSPYEPDYGLIQGIPQSEVDAVAARFKLDPARKRIVFCARLVEVKRPDLAIDSFAAIAHQRPDWDLLMIGDGVLRDFLRLRVASDLRHRVLWAGFVPDQRVVSCLYRACHVMVLPSDYEPWALVVNEAVAADLAMVTSRVVGAAEELVKDGVNGQRFDRGRRPDLRMALLEATDPNRIDALRRGSARVLADWRAQADPVVGLRRALACAGAQPDERPSDLRPATQGSSR
jgi:glycosyltransferase involved in cell wall biosynthesis